MRCFYCYVKSNYDRLNNNNNEFFYIIILCRGNKSTLQLKTIVFRCVQAECDTQLKIARSMTQDELLPVIFTENKGNRVT